MVVNVMTKIFLVYWKFSGSGQSAVCVILDFSMDQNRTLPTMMAAVTKPEKEQGNIPFVADKFLESQSH